MQLAGKTRRAGLLLAFACAALLLIGTGSSPAAVSFCPDGDGPEQCKEPAGVAVDRSTGHVYVADGGHDRIMVFDESGTFLSFFGSSGSGPGQLSSPGRIAVDNDPASPAYRDIYVVDANLRVSRFSPSGSFVLSFGAGQVHSRFSPVTVVPGGTVYLSDSVGGGRRILKFKPDGTLLGTSNLSAGEFAGEGIAVDSSGDVYVVNVQPNVIEKYEPTEPNATLLESFGVGAGTRAVAIDSSDHLFAAQEAGGFRLISERDPSGNLVKRFGYGEIETNMLGLAVGATGALFGNIGSLGAPDSRSKVLRIDQPGPGPLACCLTATPRNTSATLKGAVNPENKSATYHFDYIAEADYVANGNKFEGVNPFGFTPESAPVGSDFNLYPAEAQIGCAKVEVPPQPGCLDPGAAYRYRLVATSADGKSETQGTFTTQPPLEIEEVFATDVGTDAGRLHAVVNPLGIPATGYFEYVDDAAYQADLAEGEGHDGFAQATKVPDVDAGKSPISFGAGEAGIEVARELTALDADTLYHYRFVAGNPFVAVESAASVLTTFPVPSPPTRACPNEEFRTAASAALPECRAYEMVSPVDKNGNDIKVLLSPANYLARLDQSSADGNRFAYSSSTAFGDAAGAPWSSQYLARRNEGAGWSTHSLNAPQDSVPLSDQIQMKLDVPYKLFDSELSTGWLQQIAEPTLNECAPPGFINLYRRDLDSGGYEALIPNAPLNSKPPSGYRLELQGSSADGTRAVFRANAKLTGDAVDKTGDSAYQLYMHVAGEGCGELRLVSIRPNGVASPLPASAGTPSAPAEYRDGTVARAVSADGSRVFMTLNTVTGVGPLYVRVNADQEPSPVSAGKCTEPTSLGCTLEISASDAQFWTAAADGSRVIYSVGENLFEFDVDKALAEEPASTLIAGNAGIGESRGGVAAASEDASRIYFVSREEIDGEGKAGERNLYLYEPAESAPERYRLVATLDSLPGVHYWGFEVASHMASRVGVRVTADGGHLAFVSSASLTGYDNADAADRRPSLEAYLYDAVSEELRCISCNPSGARPRGRTFEFGFTRKVSAMLPNGETQTFAPRALTADGNRLFFESFEALLPRDTNGKGDVYEWQRASGEQACEEAGAELYVPTAGGCLSLISSGQSPVDSEFADASRDGSDVFIRTQSSLLPQDEGLIDVYDARIGGGFAQPPLPPAACEGEACQGPLSAPDDPTPASSAFEGAGNVTAEEKPASCRRPKVRRKGRCVARKPRKHAKQTKPRNQAQDNQKGHKQKR